MSINVKGLAFSYGQQAVFADVDLAIERGETLSILGPNGAGKTTLLNAIAGLIRPNAGEIRYDGRPALTALERARSIGYVPQTIHPAFDYSVLDYVVTGCAPRIGAFSRPKDEHYQNALAAIDDMGIRHLADKSYRRISGGERQQASIARAIAQRPAYILLDEPTAHLDFGNQIRVLHTIRRLADEGFGIVLTTHNPDHVLLLGGRVATIDRGGRLRSGDSHEMMEAAFLSELYGTELRTTRPDDAKRTICFAPGLQMEDVDGHT